MVTRPSLALVAMMGMTLSACLGRISTTDPVRTLPFHADEDAFDAVRGINCPDAELVSLKTRIIEISTTSWVLLDRSKLVRQQRHQYWAAVPPSVGIVVEHPTTDDEERAVDALRKAGHTVVVA